MIACLPFFVTNNSISYPPNLTGQFSEMFYARRISDLTLMQGINSLSFKPSQHKSGEVVEPAGGETGGPRSLAEDYKAAKSSLISVESIIPPMHTENKPHGKMERPNMAI